MSNIKITESRPSDISTVIAYFVNPTERYPNGEWIKCDTWSCYDGDYKLGQEREFIAGIESVSPGVYSHYHIGWCDCN
jgi:hypothetical protein